MGTSSTNTSTVGHHYQVKVSLSEMVEVIPRVALYEDRIDAENEFERIVESMCIVIPNCEDDIVQALKGGSTRRFVDEKESSVRFISDLYMVDEDIVR